MTSEADFLALVSRNCPDHRLQTDAVYEILIAIQQYKKTGTIPYFVYCVATGVRKGVTSKAQREKLLARYDGDILRLFSEYRGREAKAQEREATRPEQPKAEPGEFLVLPTEIIKGGITRKQQKRVGDVALYEVEGSNPKNRHLEVIIVQRHNGLTYPNGKYVSPREFFPSDNTWGEKGWTYSGPTETVDRMAEERFSSLVAKRAADL